MKIDQISALAVAIAGLLSPIIIQILKQWIPKDWRAAFAVVLSILIAAGAVVLSKAPSWSWLVMVTAVVGIAQTVYTIVSKLIDTTTDLDHPKPTAVPPQQS